jgi:hypothetical protein
VSHLINASLANVAEQKIRDYLLNSRHPQNGGKAGYFLGFGFQPGKWSVMRDALIGHATVNHVSGTSRSHHGTKHTVRCSISTPDGRNPCITTVWIVEGNRPPRLITSYP